jgi:Mg2+/citrate symporter
MISRDGSSECFNQRDFNLMKRTSLIMSKATLMSPVVADTHLAMKLMLLSLNTKSRNSSFVILNLEKVD